MKLFTVHRSEILVGKEDYDVLLDLYREVLRTPWYNGQRKVAFLSLEGLAWMSCQSQKLWRCMHCDDPTPGGYSCQWYICETCQEMADND